MNIELILRIKEILEKGKLSCPICKSNKLTYESDGDVNDLGIQYVSDEYISCNNCETIFDFKIIPVFDRINEEWGNDDFTIELNQREV